MTKCYYCGGKLKKENVDIARHWGKKLVALNDVPSFVCTRCGERYFEAKVSHKIDEKIQNVLKRRSSVEKIDVPVVYF